MTIFNNGVTTMLESISLPDIGAMVGFLVALITGVAFLMNTFKKWIKDSLKDELDPLKEKLSSMEKDLEEVDMENTKNFLVRFLADVEQGNMIDEIEKERFWEQYERYTKKGRNGYVKRKVDKLKEKGLL